MSDEVFNYKMRVEKLFDSTPCKCLNFDTSSCKKSKQVSLKERAFLTVQKTDHNLFTNGIDKEVTIAWKTAWLRKSKDLARRKFVLTKAITQENGVFLDSNSSQGTHYPNKPVVQANAKGDLISSRNLISLSNTDRYGISNLSASAITTAILQYVSFINDSDTYLVVDKHDVKRERLRIRITI